MFKYINVYIFKICMYIYTCVLKNECIHYGFLWQWSGAACPMPTGLFVSCAFAVSILHEDWCWKNKSLEVEVLEDDVSAVEFRQTGYMLRCSLSHAITLVRTASEGPFVWKGPCLWRAGRTSVPRRL